MLIDMHAHIWRGNYEENKKELIKASTLYGISKIYISGLGSLIPDEEEISELNREVYHFMKEESELIEGMCYINPRHKNAMDVLRNGIEDFGMSGMKLWVATYCDVPDVNPLMEECIRYRIPILVHAFHKAVGQLDNESLGRHVAKLASRYPEAKIIMAHLGGNCYDGIKAIKNFKNVSVDISGSLFRRDEVDYTVKHIGPERILFGSDMIGSFLVNYGQIEEADLSSSQRDLIYYKNAQKIFDRS